MQEDKVPTFEAFDALELSLWPWPAWSPIWSRCERMAAAAGSGYRPPRTSPTGWCASSACRSASPPHHRRGREASRTAGTDLPGLPLAELRAWAASPTAFGVLRPGLRQPASRRNRARLGAAQIKRWKESCRGPASLPSRARSAQRLRQDGRPRKARPAEQRRPRHHPQVRRRNARPGSAAAGRHHRHPRPFDRPGRRAPCRSRHEPWILPLGPPGALPALRTRDEPLRANGASSMRGAAGEDRRRGGTPVYVYSSATLERHYTVLRDALGAG